MHNRHLIKDILQTAPIGETLLVAGWVRSVRKGGQCSFVVLNDGSCQRNLQIVADKNVSGLLTGTCIKASGTIVASQGKGQDLEMQAKSIEIVGPVDATYPLQKKSTSLEFLRQRAHLRPRSNLFSAIFRLRHRLSMATHRFFDQRGFYYLHTPIITAVDAEGAGETFQVTSLDLDKVKGKIDYSKDYFGKESSLCVTGQLEAECFAMGMNAVYTFGPTFRAENSNTPRHLAEFWMVEPEAAFMDLEGNADLAEDYFKCLVTAALEECGQELEALAAYHRFSSKEDTDIIKNLEQIKDTSFERITYTKAIELCQKSGRSFEFGSEWGIELQTEHERYLSEEVFSGSVIVTDYPKDIKAFYMKQNEDGKTVRAMDVLVPGVGEIIGGSEREDDLEKLTARMCDMNMDSAPLWWYLELRKFGSAPHSGFGLGLERVLRYITGMKNIRDVIAFPRTPKNCDF